MTPQNSTPQNSTPRNSRQRNEKGHERSRPAVRSRTAQAPGQRTRAADPARLVAFEVLRAVSEDDAYANLVLPKSIRKHQLDKRDAGFATELAYGALRGQGTYDAILDRCYAELIKGTTTHLIVLLGVPIAYPRLVWLENILTSRIMDPIKALSRAGAFGNLLNNFDGGVEILDDLDDHWTSKNHKAERRFLIQDLQDLAASKSVRITILSGDVHLAAIGQFFSSKHEDGTPGSIPKDKDHRYMPNVISSAIVNTPPPDMLADVLAKRDKIHHLDGETDENMIPLFGTDVDGKKRNNKVMLPRRNWASIRVYDGINSPPGTPGDAGRSPGDVMSTVLTAVHPMEGAGNCRTRSAGFWAAARGRPFSPGRRPGVGAGIGNSGNRHIPEKRPKSGD